eukprot:gene6521-4698_t
MAEDALLTLWHDGNKAMWQRAELYLLDQRRVENFTRLLLAHTNRSTHKHPEEHPLVACIRETSAALDSSSSTEDWAPSLQPLRLCLDRLQKVLLGWLEPPGAAHEQRTAIRCWAATIRQLLLHLPLSGAAWPSAAQRVAADTVFRLCMELVRQFAAVVDPYPQQRHHHQRWEEHKKDSEVAAQRRGGRVTWSIGAPVPGPVYHLAQG